MDKRLKLVVEAVTSEAQKRLRELRGEVEALGKGGTASALGLGDLESRANDLLGRTQQLGAEARNLRGEMQGSTQSLGLWGGAMQTAAGAAVALGAGWAAMKIGEKAVDMARTAAAAQGVEESFDKLAARSQMDSKALLGAMDAAAKGTVDDYDLMKQHNVDWYKGVSKNVGQYTDLIKIAEEKSKDFGISTLEYWQRMDEAISSGYSASLRHLGIVLDMDQAYENYGQKIGKAGDELDEYEQIQARVEATIANSASSLRDWDQAGEDATTTAQQFDATTTELSHELAETFLPAVIEAEKAVIGLKRALFDSDEAAESQAEMIIRTSTSYEEMAQRLSQLQAYQEQGGRWAKEGTKDWQEQTTTLEAWQRVQQEVQASYADMDLKLRDARRTTEGVTDSIKLNTDALEAQEAALEKGADVWGNYLRDVGEENWKFGQQVANAQFSAGQAAERAAFDLERIEKDAANRRSDILERADIRDEAQEARHANAMYRLRRDLRDDLADLEWDYQQERRQMMDQAPWWIRQALSKEFQERERIRKTGDKDALRAFDAALLEQIRAIDPVYARQIELLQERYEHEEKITKRESRQARRDEKEDYRISEREQERSLDLQLRNVERSLEDRRAEWAFHQQQREAQEHWAMQRLITDHEHSLDQLYETTMIGLAKLTPLFEHFGQEWSMALIQGMATGAPYTPLPYPGYNPFENWTNPFAAGAPATMGAAPAAAAPQPIAITNVFPGGYNPYQAEQVANRIEAQLGAGIRTRSR
jgi:hypothetical protein